MPVYMDVSCNKIKDPKKRKACLSGMKSAQKITRMDKKTIRERKAKMKSKKNK